MQTITVEDLSYQPNSELFFEAVRDLPEAVWLDSGKPRSLQGRFDIISACPDAIVETSGTDSKLLENGSTQTLTTAPFELAEQLLAPLLPVDPAMTGFPFVGGLIGYFSYDLGRHLIKLPSQADRLVNLPEMRIGRYLWGLVVNHQAQQCHLFFHAQCPDALKQDITKRLKEVPSLSKVDRTFTLRETFSATISETQYSDAIERIKHYISAGDCYQANFAQHFSAPFTGDPWGAYLTLRNSIPSPYSAFWQWEDKALLSLSPERFVKVSVNQVESKPIKGTAKRGSTVAEDQENAIALLNSTKDRAENLMIVDLLRNDLGKHCAPGSIRAPKLFALESFPNVHHLVSTVTGTLADGASPLDLLKGCFPGGSITGAPKKRAMEIIEELEPVRRSVYCGSIGYISATKRMDTNIAIRTLIADSGTLHCWGGGGIVTDSSVQSEYRESLDKIQLLMQSLENTCR